MENQQPHSRAKQLTLMDMASAFIILGLNISLYPLWFFYVKSFSTRLTIAILIKWYNNIE